MGIAPRKRNNTTGRTIGQTKSTNKPANQANPPLSKQELDDLQALIGLLGFLPGLGIGADLINAAISAIRSNLAGALFDLFSAIPAIGDAAKGAKVIQDIDKYLGVVNRLQNTVIKKIPNKTIANKLQKVLNEVKEELNKQKSVNKKQETGKGNNNQQTAKSTQKDSTVKPKPKLKCGQLGSFAELGNNGGYDGHQRDHIPSKAALLEAARKIKREQNPRNPDLTPNQISAIIAKADTIAIPVKAHQQASRTYGGRNNSEQIIKDAKDLAKAARRDVDTIDLLQNPSYAKIPQ